MKIKNIATYLVTISDLRLHKGSIGCTILPGQILEVFDDDAAKSVGLAELLAAGSIVTITSPFFGFPFVDKPLTGSAYIILSTDNNIRITGAGNQSATLPVTGLELGQIIRVSNGTSGAGNVTVNATGGAAIGNSGNDTSEVVWTYGNISTFQWDGSKWWVVSH